MSTADFAFTFYGGDTVDFGRLSRGMYGWFGVDRFASSEEGGIQKMASCSIRSIRSSRSDSLVNVAFVVGFIFTLDVFGASDVVLVALVPVGFAIDVGLDSFAFVFAINVGLVVIDVRLLVVVTAFWSPGFPVSLLGFEPNLYVHSSILCQVSVLDDIFDDVRLWLYRVNTNNSIVFTISHVI